MTRSLCVQVDQQLTASLESRLSPLVIALFLKYGQGWLVGWFFDWRMACYCWVG